MNQKVLFIDDEEKILLSLKRLFRGSEYDIHFVSSGVEGLEFLRNNPVSVIVSDMKMPEMNGVEFLEEAMKICPDAIRIILSGYSEADRIMAAINKGHIWRFIPKPWNNDEIRVTLKNAVDFYLQNREKMELTERLRQKTEELDAMNRLLEKRVKERTWQLNERTRLLNMLLEDADLETILSQITISISKILGGVKVYMRSLMYDKLYCSAEDGDLKLPSGLAEAEKQMLDRGENISDGNYLTLLLKKSDTRLGTLLIERKTISQKINIEEKISGFTSLLDIVLFQHKSLASAPGLIKDIDKMIGSI